MFTISSLFSVTKQPNDNLPPHPFLFHQDKLRISVTRYQESCVCKLTVYRMCHLLKVVVHRGRTHTACIHSKHVRMHFSLPLRVIAMFDQSARVQKY